MTVETFFEKFELFADAQDAVEKMRDLVLALAFNGGLSGTTQDDTGTPIGWTIQTIDELCNVIEPGFACSKTKQAANGHVHLRTHNVSTLGVLNFDLIIRIDPDEVDASKSSIKQGDILFNNTNSQELVGKTALVDRDYDYAFSNHITRLRVNATVWPAFVVYYLTFLRNSGHFERLCTRWIGQAAINTKVLKQQKIPLPPLAEQKRIVAKVDELMGLCDRLEAQRQEREQKHAALSRAALARFAEAPTPANLEYLFHESYTIDPTDLRKSILTLAVQGKLVEQDADDEPVARWAKHQPVDIVDSPRALPRGWEWLGFSSIFDCAGGIQKTPARTPKQNAFPYLGVSNVQRGRLDLANVKQFELEEGELERRRLLPNDLLIVEGNGSADEIGRCAKWQGEIENCVHQNHVHRCRPIEAAIADYVILVLNSPYGVATMQSLAITSSGLYSLSLGKIRQLLIPLPPLAEQRRIVAKVYALMALVDQLEAQLAESRSLASELMEAVVAELTTGRKPSADTRIVFS